METQQGGSGWALADLGSEPWARTRTQTEGERDRKEARITEKQKVEKQMEERGRKDRNFPEVERRSGRALFIIKPVVWGGRGSQQATLELTFKNILRQSSVLAVEPSGTSREARPGALQEGIRWQGVEGPLFSFQSYLAKEKTPNSPFCLPPSFQLLPEWSSSQPPHPGLQPLAGLGWLHSAPLWHAKDLHSGYKLKLA